MQVNWMVSALFVIISTLHAANISTILAGNDALTTITLSSDIALVALTPQSGIVAAQVITGISFPSVKSYKMSFVRPANILIYKTRQYLEASTILPDPWPPL